MVRPPVGLGGVPRSAFKSWIISIGYTDGLCRRRGHDQKWGCSDTHSPKLNGAVCNESCRSRRPGLRRREVIVSSSRRSCTAPRPAFLGAIFLSGLARGSRSTTASRIGRNEAIGQRYFVSCASRSTRPARFSMALLSALTKMRRAEGGDRMQCFGTLSRRRFDKAPRRRRHPRPPAPHRAHGGPTPRNDDGR